MRKNFSPLSEDTITIKRRLNRGETYFFTVLSKDWNYQRFTVTKDARANLSYILNTFGDWDCNTVRIGTRNSVMMWSK